MMPTSSRLNFVTLSPGDLAVAPDGKTYRLTHVLSVDSVLGVNVVDESACSLAADTLRKVSEAPSESVGSSFENPGQINLLGYSEAEWQEGQRRFQIIKPLLDRDTAPSVEKQAELGQVNVATVYRWLARYRKTGSVSSLVPDRRGRKFGSQLIGDEQEAIIHGVIDEFYLHKQRRSSQQVIEEVMRRCRLAKIDAPHPNTIRNRINRLPQRITLRRRGHVEEANNRFTPVRGKFPGADFPLAIVQIDHTPADIICVDEVHRKPVGRPYLTLAMDVFSRMVVGFYLSYDPPSAASVGLCLAQAMCSKREYLAKLGVKGSWPVWGKITTVHCDNAREFRGVVLERACEEYGIDLSWRPVKTPRYGGHIERMMGTVSNELHKLPGTTFSNPQKRKGYNSHAEASVTLRELERYLVEFFVNIYHQRVHTQLHMPPLRKWEQGIMGDENINGIGQPKLPNDPEKMLLDFMPYEERTIQNYGIQIDKINYYDPILDPYINALEDGERNRKKTFLIRRDPRDISKVYFFDPASKHYFPIPYRNLGYPAISLFELREVRKRLKIEGKKDVDEVQIFEALERMREGVVEAQAKSKAARRHLLRTPKPDLAILHQPAAPAMAKLIGESVITKSTEPEDPFAGPIEPFETRLLE